MSERAPLPWHHPDLEGWSIVGMNHYHQDGQRRLFIAMTNDAGRCIQTEGPDAPALWVRLRVMAAKAKQECVG